MLRVISCTLLYVSLSSSQVAPYGSTPLPFVPSTIASAFSPSPSPTIPPVTPPIFPFSPTPRPLLPGYNNPYYNPTGPAIPILTYSNVQTPDGTYDFSFSTADGKQVQENGYLKDAYVDQAGELQGTQVVQGSFAYVAPDGTPIQVSYVADENGFRPSGVHIPANGKGFPPQGLSPTVPTVGDGNKDNKVFDPYNRFDPYRYDPYNRNRLGYFGQRPFDPRIPYDNRYPFNPASYNPYNPYRPFNGFKNNKAANEGPKKTPA